MPDSWDTPNGQTHSYDDGCPGGHRPRLTCLDCHAEYDRDPNRRLQPMFCELCSASKADEREAFAEASKLDGERRAREKAEQDYHHDQHANGKHRGINVLRCDACRIAHSEAMTVQQEETGIPRALR